MKRALILMCAALAACQSESVQYDMPLTLTTTTLWEQDEELNGYIEPEACRRDLSWVDAPVFYVPTAKVEQIFQRVGLGHVRGMVPGGASVRPEYSADAGVPPGIYLNADMPDRGIEIILHHERCHWATDWDHSDWKPKRP